MESKIIEREETNETEKKQSKMMPFYLKSETWK